MTGLALMGLLPAGAVVEGRALFGGADLLRLPTRGAAARSRGREVAMVFQDPMTSLHPMLTVGRQLTEHVAPAPRPARARPPRRARRAARAGALPDPERRARALPAPVLRRHAPAHRHRHRARLRPEAADRRRADDGARRDRAGGHPPPARPAAPRDAACRAADHPRPRRDVGARRHACSIFYAGRVVESGPAGEVLQRPAPSVHAQPARRLPHPEVGAARAAASPIPGAPPSPQAAPDRAARSTRAARTPSRRAAASDVPALVPVGGGRRLACRVDPFRGERE